MLEARVYGEDIRLEEAVQILSEAEEAFNEVKEHYAKFFFRNSKVINDRFNHLLYSSYDTAFFLMTVPEVNQERKERGGCKGTVHAKALSLATQIKSYGLRFENTIINAF
jgi:hypothetical protein